MSLWLIRAGANGELVPQDPNDEPASTLLERLRGQLGSPPAGKRRMKRP